ncbi:MAG: hypothetical protein IT305_05230 [Chloroflexi bacterium]|nr:hypothetical protein [Chloroflexota bacterium]
MRRAAARRGGPGRRWLWTAAAVLVLALVVVGLAFFLLQGQPSQPVASDRPAGLSPSPAAELPYQIFFTSPTYPDRPENRHGGIDERLVAFIDASTSALDVADYDFDLENVAQAMARAKGRGVVVRMVTDSDTLDNTRDKNVQRAFQVLRNADVPIVPDERQAIMHDKFVVRDNEYVWTGSWNFTTGDTYRLNNNAVWFHSPDLARVYTREFDQMFVEKKFGGGRGKAPPAAPVQIGPLRVQPLFAPEDSVAQHIIERLDGATDSIHFLAFSFTHDGIGKAVMGRAQAGVKVAGVFERTGSETRFSEYGVMKRAGLEVYQDGNPYAMHHKVFIIDGRTTVFGSFNFSDSADRDNDENCLIVDDPRFAQQFEVEFQRMLAAAQSAVKSRDTQDRQEPR